jgi:Protein of unknown function (DUF2752)
LTTSAHETHRWFAVLLLALLLASLVVLYCWHPGDIAALPPCPAQKLTGLYCPGCGSLRAIHHLLHGRLTTAWQHNPAMLVLGVPALLLYAVELSGRARGRSLTRGSRSLPWLGWGLLALLLLFTIARNLPTPATNWMRPPAATDTEQAAPADA